MAAYAMFIEQRSSVCQAFFIEMAKNILGPFRGLQIPETGLDTAQVHDIHRRVEADMFAKEPLSRD